MILTSPLAGRDAIVQNKASIGVNCHNYSAHILSVVMTRMFLYCSCIGARKQTSCVLYRWIWNGYVVHINAIVDAIGDKCKRLLGMHTVSGCYTASYFIHWMLVSCVSLRCGPISPVMNLEMSSTAIFFVEVQYMGAEDLSRVYTPYAVVRRPKCANESTQIRA